MNGWNATQWIDVINTIQKPFMALNPPIPMIYGLDSVHGATYIKGAALFPHVSKITSCIAPHVIIQNIAVASSFNPELAEKAARVAAKDTRASGVPWAFTPVLGVGVMPLWPRVYETFGEDPYLASVMGTHVVTGIQDNNNFTSPQATSACIKHFLGYPAQKSGKDRSTAWVARVE
jgi:beta-glucosidase